MGLSLKKLASKAFDQINPLDNGLTWQQRTPTSNKSVIGQVKAEASHAPSQLKKAGTAVGLGAVRSATGMAQGATGLYDLATPGRGTSRASDLLSHFAQLTDQTAQNEHVDPFLYHASQFGTDIASFAVGAGEANLAARGLMKAPQISRFLAPVVSAAPRIGEGIDAAVHDAPIVQKAMGTAAKNLLSFKNQAANAAFTAKMTGENASKGGKTTIASVGKNLGMGELATAGLPAAGAIAKPIIKSTGKAVTSTAKKTADAIKNYEGPDKVFADGPKITSKPSTVPPTPKPKVAPEPSITAYHGSTNNKLTSLTPGSKTGLNEKRNLIYLTEDKQTAGDYAKTRGTDGSGQGELSKSPTGRVYKVNVQGKVLGAYDHEAIAALRTGKHYENLSGKTKNMLTNDTGLSTSQLEANPELRDFLRKKGVTAVRSHLPNGGGSHELAVIDHKKISLGNKPTIGKKVAKNSYGKTQIADVAPGDYQGARIASQQIAEPVREIGARWQHAMNKLKKANPEEHKNFWRHVENLPATASPQLKEAVSRWRMAADRVQSHANAYGKKTAYIKDFALHPWDLSGMTEEQLAKGGGGVLHQHAKTRKYSSIAEGEKAGLKLGNDPTSEGLKYLNGSSHAISRLAGKRALEQADAHEAVKTRTLDLGFGHTVQLSEKGYRKARALETHTLSDKKIIKGARTVNVASKSAILSLGQFHPINIAALRAGPALALKGHPINAAKGVYRTFRVLGPGGNKVADKVLMKAYNDGMMDKAAQLGMPYGQQGYNKAGTILKKESHGVVFGKQMPMMHDQMVRSLVKDLEKKKISLNSKDAHAAGVVGNATMGFINKEALNMSPRLRQGMSDFMLAGQFTPSKIVTVGKVGAKGVAGTYARADVASNSLAALGLIAGIGYLVHQKSDNIKDTILRALVDPAAPTPFKDAKGNNIEVGLPATYTGEISKLLGIGLERGKDGHLQPTFSPPTSMPGNVVDYARARLSPGISDTVSLATNTDFGNKKLSDPNAPAGLRAEQAATTLASGHLPIGLQGAAQTKLVKDHVPGNVKDVLDANTPGVNPLAKSGSASMGFRLKTDKTVGKGKETSDYFGALDKVKRGLNNQEAAAMEIYAGNKKNPITGKYEVKPNSNDSQTKAKVLLQNPRVIDRLQAMNKQLKANGAKTDPLWGASKDQVKAVVAYQSMPYAGPDRAHWYAQNKDWYQPLSDSRSKFFQGLPKGDPNKPQAPIEYPSPTKAIASQMEQFNKITDSKDRAVFMEAHPEVQTQLDAQAKYGNDMRAATGYSKLDVYPEASGEVKSIIKTYNALPLHDGPKGGSKTRSLWIQSHAGEFKKMTEYYTGASLYGLEKEASQAEFADTTMSQKGLKEISNLGTHDIKKNSDGSYSLGSSSSTSGGSGGSSKGYTDSKGKFHYYRSYSSGGSSSTSAYKDARYLSNSQAFTVNPPKAGGSIKANSVSVHKASIKSRGKTKLTKPKLTRKHSKA